MCESRSVHLKRGICKAGNEKYGHADRASVCAAFFFLSEGITVKKRNKKANFIMVAIIVLLAAGGVGLALGLRTADNTGIGSQYHINEPENNAVLIDGQEKTCTITIVCDTILDNLDSLEEEKAPYVPKDAVILPVTTVSFADGETVFEVLQRVCTAADIQLEFSWTPLYSSYYIEGINHLYEFDCGPESGWMYKVNEWFPNYGCSAYSLEGGEEIVWCYTCNGLGADVGEVWMGDSE